VLVDEAVVARRPVQVDKGGAEGWKKSWHRKKFTKKAKLINFNKI
jgi:hypothetical protein